MGVAWLGSTPTPPQVLTLWKRSETLLVNARAAMSQWILKTLYLAGR